MLYNANRSFGAFVYRLGRQILNLERGVQLPYALLFNWSAGILPAFLNQTQH